MSLDEWVQPTVDPEVRAFVGSLVTALGGTSIEEHGRYVLGDDALGCLKDIRRWIRHYDQKFNRLDVQRVLAESNLVKGDLLEILASWTDDQTENKLKSKIALACLELLVPLTWPLEIEEEKFTVNHHRHLPYLRLAQVDYKRAILQHDTAKILQTVARIALPSMGIEMKDRTPREDGIIRLVLYFFRNVAMISQPHDLPADVDEAEISRSATIDAFHSQLAFDVLLAMSSSMGDQYAMQDVVLLEVLFYLLKGIDPDRLFLDDKELIAKQGDELRDLMEKEKTLLGGYKRYAPSRHNRFGTMVWIKRDDDKVSTVTGQSVISGPDRAGLLQMDKSKKWNKPKYKGRNAVETDPTSEFDKSVMLSATARRHLRHFVENFMDSAFNPLFAHVRKAIEREAERVLHQHPMQFFYLISWFLQAESARRRRAKQRQDDKSRTRTGAPQAPEVESFSLIASVLNQETFILVNRYLQRSIDDKDWQQLNAGMKCFTRILLTVQDLSESPYEDDQEIAENIQNRIFYEESTHDRIIGIVRNYKDQGFGYLDACTELAHTFIRMLERYSKENVDMQIRSKRRARRKKKEQHLSADGSANSEAYDDHASEAEDRREAETVSRERKFDFSRFQARFMSQACVDTFIAFLKFFNDLSAQQLKRIHRYLYRVAFKNELSVILFRVDIIQLLHRMIKGPEGLNPDLPSFKEWEELSRNIFKKLIKRLRERPELMVEMLFSKIPATTYYLEHGHDKELPVKMARPAVEWELQAGVDKDRGIGAVVGLLNVDDKIDLAAWVKDELGRAFDERKSWVAMHEGRIALGEPEASNGSEVPSILVKPGSKEVEKAMFRNGKLRLLMSLVGFERLGPADDSKASYIIRPSVTLEQLQHAKELVERFIETPQEYDDGTFHDDLVRRKPTKDERPHQAGIFDDDDSSEDVAEYDEGATLFPPGGPTARKSDALEELKKRRKVRKGQKPLDEEEKSKRAEARQQANLEKLRKIKSDVFVHSSDEESDEDRDKEFFAMEEKRHKAAVSNMRTTISQLAKKSVGLNNKKRKGHDDYGAVNKRRRSSSPGAANKSDEEIGRLIEISESSSSDNEMGVDAESGADEQDTPLSSQHNLPHGGKDNAEDDERGEKRLSEAGEMEVDIDEDMEDAPIRKVQARRNVRAGFLIDIHDNGTTAAKKDFAAAPGQRFPAKNNTNTLNRAANANPRPSSLPYALGLLANKRLAMKTARPKWGQNQPAGSQYTRIPSDPSQAAQGRKTAHQDNAPSRLRRLSSFTNTLASPFNALKSRSFSRTRQSSNGTMKSSSRFNLGNASSPSVPSNHHRPNPAVVASSPAHPALAASKSSTNITKPRASALPRSTTTSFLPLHTGGAGISPPKPPAPLVQSQSTTSFYRSRLPTPVRDGRASIGSQGRQPSVPALAQADMNVSRSRIPTPIKVDGFAHANNKSVLSPKSFVDYKKPMLGPRSKTQPNLLSAMRSRYSVTGKENRPGDTSRLLETTYEEKTPFRADYSSPIRKDEESHSDSSSDDGLAQIETASFAFSPRKMTPSMALETALASHIGRKVSREGTQRRPPTPAAIKKLESITSRPGQPRLSSGHMITQYKLLQPIQPDSPPLSSLATKTLSPSTSNEPATPRASEFNAFLARRNSPVKPQTSLRTSMDSDRQSPEDDLSPSLSQTRPGFASARLARQVTTAQPMSYWAGRYTSLHDRLLNEAFSVEARPVDPSDAYKTRPSSNCRSSSEMSVSRASDLHRAEARDRRIFQLLEASCVSDDAVASLKAFQNRYARVYDVPALRCPVPRLNTAKASKSPNGTPRTDADGENSNIAHLRKPTFMDRLLMGRKNGRRSSGRMLETAEETKTLVRAT